MKCLYRLEVPYALARHAEASKRSRPQVAHHQRDGTVLLVHERARHGRRHLKCSLSYLWTTSEFKPELDKVVSLLFNQRTEKKATSNFLLAGSQLGI